MSFTTSPYATTARNIAFAFPCQEDCMNAKHKIEETYTFLKTSTEKQLLRNGYEFILFVENKKSLNFNLLIGKIVGEFNGVPRQGLEI